MWVITVFLEDQSTTMYEFETEEEARDALKNIKGIKIVSKIVYFNEKKPALTAL